MHQTFRDVASSCRGRYDCAVGRLLVGPQLHAAGGSPMVDPHRARDASAWNIFASAYVAFLLVVLVGELGRGRTRFGIAEFLAPALIAGVATWIWCTWGRRRYERRRILQNQAVRTRLPSSPCPACGTINSADASFCQRCGSRLTPRTASGRTTSGMPFANDAGSAGPPATDPHVEQRAAPVGSAIAPVASAGQPRPVRYLKLVARARAVVPLADGIAFWLQSLVFLLVLAGSIEATGAPPGGILRGSFGAVVAFGAHTLAGIIFAVSFVAGWLAIVLAALGLVGALRRKCGWHVGPVGVAFAIGFGLVTSATEAVQDWLGSVSPSDAAALWAALVGTAISLLGRSALWVLHIWRWSNVGDSFSAFSPLFDEGQSELPYTARVGLLHRTLVEGLGQSAVLLVDLACLFGIWLIGWRTGGWLGLLVALLVSGVAWGMLRGFVMLASGLIVAGVVVFPLAALLAVWEPVLDEFEASPDDASVSGYIEEAPRSSEEIVAEVHPDAGGSQIEPTGATNPVEVPPAAAEGHEHPPIAPQPSLRTIGGHDIKRLLVVGSVAAVGIGAAGGALLGWLRVPDAPLSNQPQQEATPRPSEVPRPIAPVSAPPPAITAPAAVAPPGPPAEPATPLPAQRLRVVSTGGQGANLRDRPSLTAARVATLPEGSVVEAIETESRAEGRAWRFVRDAMSRTGWIAAEFLETTTLPIAIAATPTPLIPTPMTAFAGTVRYVANTDGMGVRIRPICEDQARAGVWPEGTRVVIEFARGDCAGWYWVRDASGQSSWVRGDFLSERDPTARITPTPVVTSPPTARLTILTPGDGARVAQRITVRGIQRDRLPAPSHLWLIVRPLVAGGAWYPGPAEVLRNADGTWSQEIFLGGPPGVRHEIRIGVIDDSAHADWLHQIRERPNQPLIGWQIPDSWGEARVTVVRQ